MVVVAIAVRAPACKRKFTGKLRMIHCRHIVIEAAQCGDIFFQTEFCQQIAYPAGIKGRRILVERFSVLNRKFPGYGFV